MVRVDWTDFRGIQGVVLRPCSDTINLTRPMSRRTRRTHSPSFKAKVALAAVGGDRTLAEQRRRTSVRRQPLFFTNANSQKRYIGKTAATGLSGRNPDKGLPQTRLRFSTIHSPWPHAIPPNFQANISTWLYLYNRADLCRCEACGWPIDMVYSTKRPHERRVVGGLFPGRPPGVRGGVL